MNGLIFFVIFFIVVMLIAEIWLFTETERLKAAVSKIRCEKLTWGADYGSGESATQYITSKSVNPFLNYGQNTEEDEIFYEPELWMIPKLELGKIYYLSYPCTTGDRSIGENKKREAVLYDKIMKRNPGAKIIRPLTIIPIGYSHGMAMKRCFKLLDASDCLIVPEGWSKSTGCTMEYARAEEKQMEKVYLSIN